MMAESDKKALTRIAIGSDHAGYQYKHTLIEFLEEMGLTVVDTGISDLKPADYPDVAMNFAEVMLGSEIEKGVLICGSGVGVCVAVNKIKGMRAGICHDAYSAHQGVEHDNMNVLCMGQRIIGMELAKEIVSMFIKARFSNEERHLRRLNKVLAIEERNMKKKPLL